MNSFLILFVSSPFIISGLTGLIKMLPPITALEDSTRTPAVRAIAATLSFVYILFGMYMTGNVDPNTLSTALQAFALAVVPWLGSMGVFHAFFQSKAAQVISAVTTDLAAKPAPVAAVVSPVQVPAADREPAM